MGYAISKSILRTQKHWQARSIYKHTLKIGKTQSNSEKKKPLRTWLKFSKITVFQNAV